MNIGNSTENMLCKLEENNKYYVDELNLTLDMKNNSQSIIANSINDNSFVLDVGCGAGALGKLLTQVKKCKVHGIDIDGEALKIAEKYYDRVENISVSDISSTDYTKFMNNNLKYDYIVFADLVEHILDPGQLLYDFSKKLNENGKLLVSIPNVGHWDIVLGLLNDKFNYNKTGLLDTTHVRFYTYNSFLDLLKNINDKYNMNLSAKLIGQTKINPDVSQNMLEYLNKNFSSQLFTFQNILEISNNGEVIKKRKNNNNIKKLEKILEHENQYSYLVSDNQNKAKDIESLTKECKELIDKSQKYKIENSNLVRENLNLAADNQNKSVDIETLTKECKELIEKVLVLEKALAEHGISFEEIENKITNSDNND